MSGEASETMSARPGSQVSRERVVWFASIVFCALFPLAVLAALFVLSALDSAIAMDFRQFYWAAEAILRGESPYPARDEPLLPWGGPYPYPPLPALIAAPLTALPFEVAGLLVMASLLAAALATLAVLGVRDWRCYGIALLWPPVLSAVQTGNVTLWFALALAIVWRYRDRAVVSGAPLGVTLAVKFLLWPLVVWLAATRRYLSAVLACAVGAALLLVSWAVIGFSGLRDYPDLLRRLEDVVGLDSYTVYIVGLDLGLPSPVARAIWLALGLGVLAGVAVVARQGDQRSAFVLAVAAALALSPLVWLHYFALLLAVVALARPRLGALWFVPLAFVITPGSGQPTPFETAWTLAVAAVVVAGALRATRAREGEEPSRALASAGAA